MKVGTQKRCYTIVLAHLLLKCSKLTDIDSELSEKQQHKVWIVWIVRERIHFYCILLRTFSEYLFNGILVLYLKSLETKTKGKVIIFYNINSKVQLMNFLTRGKNTYFVLKMFRLLCFPWILKLRNLWRHHGHHCILENAFFCFSWIQLTLILTFFENQKRAWNSGL